MKHLRIFPHNPGSQGAKELAIALDTKRIKHVGSKYRPRDGDTIINWGHGADQCPTGRGVRILNDPKLVARASNKLSFFRNNQGAAKPARVPEWTDDQQTARAWINGGAVVVARTVLNGHSGIGIKILEQGVDFEAAPLYTRYIKKESEYRVHVAFGKVIDIQRKIKNPDIEVPKDWRVRNHDNGFIYVRNDIHPDPDVSEQALLAAEASGLDFGAVDVIWNLGQKLAYVLEINTAPGLTGQTVDSYANAFKAALA